MLGLVGRFGKSSSLVKLYLGLTLMRPLPRIHMKDDFVWTAHQSCFLIDSLDSVPLDS